MTKDDQCNVICLTDVSKNGTFVNGKRVGKNQKVILKDATKIAVGHINYAGDYLLFALNIYIILFTSLTTLASG